MHASTHPRTAGTVRPRRHAVPGDVDGIRFDTPQPALERGYRPAMDFREAIEIVGKSVDAAGVGVMVLGFLFAAVLFFRDGRNSDSYKTARHRIGRAILLGLEVLVAGDIIRTVALSPSFRSVGILAVIILIRTFLSFTLEMEVSGRWPWQQGQSSAAAS